MGGGDPSVGHSISSHWKPHAHTHTRAHTRTRAHTPTHFSQVLANHYDHRNRWGDGIATVAWCESDSSDSGAGKWELNMERGPSSQKERVVCQGGPGTAYIIEGAAQGTTKFCCANPQQVAHDACECCWTHGITPVAVGTETNSVRQSMTIRYYDEQWGRAGQKGVS